MSDLPGELEDSEKGVDSKVWREVRGGSPRTPQPESAVGGSLAPPLHVDQSDHWLGRIAIYYLAHPTIPNLYQCCFDYAEPWDWSRQTEHITTGRWIFRKPEGNDQNG